MFSITMDPTVTHLTPAVICELYDVEKRAKTLGGTLYTILQLSFHGNTMDKTLKRL